MELRYCEECGDVIQVETSEPANIAEHFVCERCKNGAGAPRKSAPAADIEPQSLNLFSPETIAIRRKKIDEDTATKKPKSSRLRLVKAEEAEPRSADPLRAATPAPSQAPPATPAPAVETPQPAPEAIPGSATGSATPAKSARRILFRCLHCRSTLSIRPVEKTSKLTCPHCTNVIYVTPTGRLLKNSPSVALRKGEVAPTELLTSGAAGSGTNPAASVIQRNPASVAIKKTGSVVVSKAGVRKTGSNVGLRNTAFKAEEQAPAAGQPSARFQRPAAAAAAAPRRSEVPLKDIPMASINPATSWMPKPSSAFREHEENQDPGKTAFLTEERTGDLSDLTSSPALAGVAEQFALPDLRNAPPAPSPRLGALLPDDGSQGGHGDGVPARSRPRANAARRAPVPAKPAPRFTHPRDGAGHAIRGLFLLVCICAPLLVAGLILTKHADATGGLPDDTPSVQGGMLEKLGGIAQQGVRYILGTPADPYAE